MAIFVDEKSEANEVEKLSNNTNNSNGTEKSPTRTPEQDIIDSFTPEEQRKIIHRVDRRLVPTLGLLYAISLMDRTNLGNASIAGMSRDLGLGIAPRYSVISLVFFITYVLFQPPAIVVLRKIGPHIFLSLIAFSWGIIMIGMAFVQVWTPMIALRLILGVLEAGFFPACAYLLSIYYVRFELQKRNAAFYMIGSTVSGFTSILAYGISLMSGISGLAGWRWIFIMQGIITCVAGFIGWFALVDFPEKAHKSFKFLTQREGELICARIEQDRRDVVVEPFTWAAYLKGAADIKIWGYAAVFCFNAANTYAIAYFLPIILRQGLGFSIALSQCLVAPPYVAAAVVMLAQGWLCDKYHQRASVIVFNSLMGVLGLALLGFHGNNPVRYFGVFLATIATNANVPAILTYQANNLRGQWKRALCSATLVGAGGLGGVIGTTIFRAQDSPTYVPGIIGCMLAHGLNVAICLGLSFMFWRANQRAARGEVVIEGLAGFRYTY
ncbi:hypothetical protein FKW77_007521 [Venturia effusa]|uniref:Major facilitator superfamily (MFS) profile domain-containing protein n=1 Tax=Venturia effusa TaxID=50376 RepID=A0A517L9L2_9PEZI|nr:hypothetical protein FKW77_007521 [Venturia effusa]